MKRTALALLAIALIAPAAAQVNPQNMPPNTVYGRLSFGSGPGEAIPLSVLYGGFAASVAPMAASAVKCNPTGSTANVQDCANGVGLNGAAGQNLVSGEGSYILELVNNNSAFQELRVSTYGSAPSAENNVHWVRMDGSAASPTNTKSGMFFFSFGTRGNDGQAGAAGNAGSAGAVQALACSNWTSTDHCTQFHWEVTPAGSTTRTNKMDLVNGGLALTGAVWQGGGYITDATTSGGITISCGRILGGLLERTGAIGAPFTDTTATAQQIVQCSNQQGGGPGNGANVPIHTYFIYSNRTGQTATLAGGSGVLMGSASGLNVSNATSAMWEVIIENSTLGAEAVRFYRTN